MRRIILHSNYTQTHFLCIFPNYRDTQNIVQEQKSNKMCNTIIITDPCYIIENNLWNKYCTVLIDKKMTSLMYPINIDIYIKDKKTSYYFIFSEEDNDEEYNY